MMDMFVDTWEQRKFSEFTWNAGKRNKEDLDLEPYAITNEHGFIKQSEAHDDFGYMKDTDRKAYNIVMPNSFAYNPARINVGSIGYYEGTENVIVSSLYEVFQTADYVDDRFLWHWFKSDEFPKWIERLQEGSVRLYFYYDKLCECQMLMPSVPEQKKIAEALDNLDNLITLHQRKLEHVKKMKKSMLQKMFPKKNQLYPEVRFPGFTDAWEQRKLEDIYGSIGNAFVGTATPYYVESGHFYLESNNIKDGQINHNTEVFINDEFYEKQKDKWLHTGDMVMVQSGHVGHAAVIPEELNNSAAHALIMFRNPKKEIEPYFLNYQYQTLKSKKKIENITTGNTIKHILASEMQQFEVDMPELAEQKKIAEYFRALDHLITLHQRKQNGRNLK
jgi:type I restriction enzyme S subunit